MLTRSICLGIITVISLLIFFFNKIWVLAAKNSSLSWVLAATQILYFSNLDLSLPSISSFLIFLSSKYFKFPMYLIFFTPSFFKNWDVSLFWAKAISIFAKIFAEFSLNLFHLLKVLFVILALRRINGIFFNLIVYSS